MDWKQLFIQLIKRWEGCRLKSYKCPAGVWTCGYGTTKNVNEKTVFTEEEAELRLLEDAKNFESQLNKKIARYLKPNEKAALMSFIYNLGPGRLTPEIIELIEKEQIEEACKKLSLYVKAGGKTLQGLINRRRAECLMLQGKIEESLKC